MTCTPRHHGSTRFAQVVIRTVSWQDERSPGLHEGELARAGGTPPQGPRRRGPDRPLPRGRTATREEVRSGHRTTPG